VFGSLRWYKKEPPDFASGHAVGVIYENDMAMRRSEPEYEDDVPGEVARQIDENLKRLYGPSANDELPADLQRLIASLRAGDANPDASPSASPSAGAESK